MSRIYFHSKDEEDVAVLGTERHWMGALCMRLTEGFLDIGRFSDDMIKRLKTLIPKEHYLMAPDSRRDQYFKEDFLTAFHVGHGDNLLVWKGKKLEPFDIQLNTALLVGGDTLKLAARLHGQCEIHAWVDGPNRAWLASIIERGLAEGILRGERPGSTPSNRHDSGWSKAMEFLRASDKTPIVTSYSVCEQFPGVHLLERRAGEAPDVSDEDWHEYAFEIDFDERWDRSMDALRESKRRLELRPDEWADFRFAVGITALDLTAGDFAERLDRKLGIVKAAA